MSGSRPSCASGAVWPPNTSTPTCDGSISPDSNTLRHPAPASMPPLDGNSRWPYRPNANSAYRIEQVREHGSGPDLDLCLHDQTWPQVIVFRHVAQTGVQQPHSCLKISADGLLRRALERVGADRTHVPVERAMALEREGFQLDPNWRP